MKKFNEFKISKEVLDALEKKGFEYASEIQELVIPELLKERSHLIGQAQTGTGKTAAFAIPIIETIKVDRTVKALILAPTRELANQVADEISSIKGNKDIKVIAVYGGANIEVQIKNIKKGVDIIVGTPGRVMDLMDRNIIKLHNLEYFVLDEADEMLNMGFIEDVEKILEDTNEDKKMLFFSATLPKDILKIAKKFMPDHKTVKVTKKNLTTSLTDQIYFEVSKEDKFEALCRVLDYRSDFYGIVFCRTKTEVDDVVNRLKVRNYDAECIHGDISQAMREKSLDLFKKRILKILVATDVAARGIDVNDLTHVINYSIPQESESYVHRIGRTGRAGKKGIAITFVTSREMKKLSQIQKETKSEIKKMAIPDAKMIINSKIETLKACVEEIMVEGDYKSYIELAKSLMQGKNTEVFVASLLRHIYDDDFNEDNYKNIKGHKKQSVSDNTRLFIALGERDGFNIKKLLDFLYKKAGTPGRKIKDVKVMDKFSFVSVPYDEAEIIMEKLNTSNRNIVETAKSDKSSKKEEKPKKERKIKKK